MNTLQPELQRLIFHLLYSVQDCVSIIMDSLPVPETSQHDLSDSVPSANKVIHPWTDAETADFVEYLFQHRGEISGGHVSFAIYDALVKYLAQKHPDRLRTREAVQAKFRGVRTFQISNDLWTYTSPIVA